MVARGDYSDSGFIGSTKAVRGTRAKGLKACKVPKDSAVGVCYRVS